MGFNSAFKGLKINIGNKIVYMPDFQALIPHGRKNKAPCSTQSSRNR